VHVLAVDVVGDAFSAAQVDDHSNGWVWDIADVRPVFGEEAG
jgi:hypothetical protein